MRVSRGYAIFVTIWAAVIFAGYIAVKRLPDDKPETISQRVARLCQQPDKSARQLCETQITLRPAYERAAREVQQENR